MRHVRLSVACVCQGRPSYKKMLNTNLRGGLGGVQDQTINTRNLCQLIFRKIKKNIATMSHFKTKMHLIHLMASVRLSVCVLDEV